jgi:hypothetical protein
MDDLLRPFPSFILLGSRFSHTISAASLEVTTMQRPDVYRAIPEQLFDRHVSRTDKEQNFFTEFPPTCSDGAPIRNFSDHQREHTGWQFVGYDERTGQVTVRVPADDGRGYFAREELPLLDFYLLNPDFAPTGLRVPLSFYFDAWDRRSPDQNERLNDLEGGTAEDVYDILDEDAQLTDAKQNTLLSIDEAREVINRIYHKVAPHRPEPKVPEDARQRNNHETDRARRTDLFQLDVAESVSAVR